MRPMHYGRFTTVLAYRFGAPLLLLFLGLGLLVGEDGLGLKFNDASLAYLVGSLALAVILFDSGFRTRFTSFKVAALPAAVLATVRGCIDGRSCRSSCAFHLWAALA